MVSHNAVVENKRFGHALAVTKAQGDTYFTPKVKTNSQKLGSQERVRTVYGPTYIEAATPIADGRVVARRLLIGACFLQNGEVSRKLVAAERLTSSL